MMCRVRIEERVVTFEEREHAHEQLHLNSILLIFSNIRLKSDYTVQIDVIYIIKLL